MFIGKDEEKIAKQDKLTVTKNAKSNVRLIGGGDPVQDNPSGRERKRKRAKTDSAADRRVNGEIANLAQASNHVIRSKAVTMDDIKLKQAEKKARKEARLESAQLARATANAAASLVENQTGERRRVSDTGNIVGHENKRPSTNKQVINRENKKLAVGQFQNIEKQEAKVVDSAKQLAQARQAAQIAMDKRREERAAAEAARQARLAQEANRQAKSKTASILPEKAAINELITGAKNKARDAVAAIMSVVSSIKVNLLEKSTSIVKQISEKKGQASQAKSDLAPKVSMNFKFKNFDFKKLQFNNFNINDIVKSKYFVTGCAVLAVLVLVQGVGFYTEQAAAKQKRIEEAIEASKLYQVYLDGEYMGLVSNPSVVEKYMEKANNKFALEQEVETKLNNSVAFEEVIDESLEAGDSSVLAKIDSKLVYMAEAVTIYVNDRPVLQVPSEADAEVIIAQVMDAYVDHKEKVTLKKAEISDNVEYRSEWVELSVAGDKEIIKDIERATAILLKGTDKEVKHVVESGENIWVIANKNKVTISEIMKANPQIKSQDTIIHPGDELSLIVPEPLVNVEVVEEITEIEQIPFSVINQKNNNLYTWEMRVSTAGQHGEREVVYKITKINGQEVERELLTEKVLKEPVDQVVQKGTVGVPTNGTGSLIWPTSGGTISSYYGGARRHTGIDIANPTGTPIYAADNGTVVKAGWQGSYGNLVILTNTSSMQTYYAHMSQLGCKLGQEVKKGDIIGYVGSTGNSTGPHLHFEVRINGGTTNPLTYFPSS